MQTWFPQFYTRKNPKLEGFYKLSPNHTKMQGMVEGEPGLESWVSDFEPENFELLILVYAEIAF